MWPGKGWHGTRGAKGRELASVPGLSSSLRRPLFSRRHITGLEPRPRDKEPFFLLTSSGCLKQTSQSRESPAEPWPGERRRGAGGGAAAPWSPAGSAHPEPLLSALGAGRCSFGTRGLADLPRAAGSVPWEQRLGIYVIPGAGGGRCLCPRPPQHHFFAGLGLHTPSAAVAVAAGGWHPPGWQRHPLRAMCGPRCSHPTPNLLPLRNPASVATPCLPHLPFKQPRRDFLARELAPQPQQLPLPLRNIWKMRLAVSSPFGRCLT